jgi:surfeit locus 1 family protein
MPPAAPEVVSPDLRDSRFRCSLKFAVLVLALLPLLVALGFWQLARATAKEQALAAFDLQRSVPPLPLSALSVPDTSSLTGRRVELRGHYVPAKAFLLDNRVFRGRVGYELLMPFADDRGRIALVNRGWLQAPPTRDKLPVIDTPREELVLQGRLYLSGTAQHPALYASAGWPSVVQAIDVEALAAQAGVQAFPYLVQLAPGQPGVTEADWPHVNMSPARHRAYAVQWFLLAAGLLVVFAVGGTNLRPWLATRKHSR